jgi:hypothetical protein
MRPPVAIPAGNDALGARVAPPAAAAASVGLVSISTSDTGYVHASSKPIPVVSVQHMRMGPVRRGLLGAASVIEDELQAEGVQL